MLESNPPTEDEVIEDFTSYIQRYMPGRVNNWTVDLTDDDVEAYAKCFIYLNEYLDSDEVRAHWYSTHPFVLD